MSKKIDVYDMSVCPDCGYKQSKDKKESDDCENPNGCDSVVVKFRGKLIWHNTNWD